MKQYLLTAAAVATVFGCGSAALADDMFLGVEPQTDAAQSNLPEGFHAPIRFESLNADIMRMRPGETVTLPALGGGQPLVAELDRINNYELGQRAWVGRLAGEGLEHRVIMTETNGVAFGRIQTDEGLWHVIPRAGGGHEIMRHPDFATREPWGDDGIVPDLHDIPEYSQAQAAAETGKDLAAPNAEIGEFGTIDIAIFYTSSFTDLWGMAASGRAQYLVTLLDTALVDSDTGVRARIATLQEVSASETASNSDSLADLQDGFGDGVAGTSGTAQDFSGLLAIRDAVGADIGILLRRHFRDSRSGSSCGLGYVIGGGFGSISPGSAPFGVNVTSDWIDGDDTDLFDGYSFCSDTTLAHETGHNLGNAHNVEDASTGGLFSYSNGHREDCEFTTIMAYDSSGDVDCGGADAPGPGNEAEVLYFSNPDLIACRGDAGDPFEACGIPVGGGAGEEGIVRPLDDTTPTDNARSIRLEGHDVVDFRAEVRALRSSLLPISRSVTTGSTATAFMTVINPAAGGVTATGCGLRIAGAEPSEFSYRPWDGASFTGPADTPVSIAPGGVQNFIVSVSSATEFVDDFAEPLVSSDNNETELYIEAFCDNRRVAEYTSGLNSLLFTASAAATADVIALAASRVETPGYVEVPTTGNRVGIFSVGVSNVGSGATIVASADTGSNSSLGIEKIDICATDSLGVCITARGPTATVGLANGDTQSYAIFVKGDASVIANSPRDNRVFVRFEELGQLRGATSVAVCTGDTTDGDIC